MRKGIVLVLAALAVVSAVVPAGAGDARAPEGAPGAALDVTGPIRVWGDASCSTSSGCGPFTLGPVSVFDSASCTGTDGCGWVGTGPVAGDAATCSASIGCGVYGTGPIGLDGNVSCTATVEGCGSFGTGPVSITGDVTCTAAVGCGHMGTGPVSVSGDVSCSGTCGSGGSFNGMHLPRRGTPGVTVLGQASCQNELDRQSLTSYQHLTEFGCASVSEAGGGGGGGVGVPIETLRVPATNPYEVPTQEVLRSGVRYVIEASGVYDFSPPATVSKADAECSSQYGQPYIRDRFAAADPNGDLLDLYVNGAPVDWAPMLGTATVYGCSSVHRYTISVLGNGQRARFHIYEQNYGDNSGELVVTVYRAV